MKQYLDLLDKVLTEGNDSPDRTGIGTKSIFGAQMRFDLSKGFPAMTTKKLMWKSMVGELIWFLRGSSDVKELSLITHGDEDHRTIWHDNVEADWWQKKVKAINPTDAGRIYGTQWRDWRSEFGDGKPIDQLTKLIYDLKVDPHSRRHILTAWNPGELGEVCLPPCHIMSQFYVANGKLSCQMYQRSGDIFLGIPWNIASYSLLTHMIARICNLEVGEFIHVVGDLHLYKTHFDQAREQLSRTPLPLPTLYLNSDVEFIDRFTVDDCRLINYQHHPAIKAKMAV